MFEIDVRLIIGNPSEEALREAYPFSAGDDRIDRGSVEEAEVGRIELNPELAETQEKRIEAYRAKPFHQAVARTVVPHSIHHLMAIEPGSDHRLDQLRRVLEVCIHDDAGIGLAVMQTSQDRSLLAEVSAEGHHPCHAEWCGRLQQLFGTAAGLIGASIIHKD